MQRILLAFFLSSLFATPRALARDERTLRVMTYNIHVCRGMDGKLDVARIAKVIKDADVDVVALQEVDVKTRRTERIDEVAELAKLTGMHGQFGKAKDYDGGDYGQAILSRQPIEKLEIHKLPGQPEQEQRIALFATIKQPKPLPDLLFVGTHLHHLEERIRLPQTDELNRLLKDHIDKFEPAVMVLGDLNSMPDSEVMKRFFVSWTDATENSGFTIPADKPVRKIDYVLLPKSHGWKVVSAKVLDEPVASDHRPVVVELKWTK